MKITLNWIRSLNDRYNCSDEPAPKGVDRLVEQIGMQLGAVEEVIDLGERYQGIIVAKVVTCEKHPNADKLSVCMIDDGGKAKAVKRDSKGLVQVVCGAPNVAAGQMVAWLPPGSTVPSSFDKEPFVLEARELRGIVSNGMIASAKELAIGDSHEGILIIDKPSKPGDDFAKLYGLNDHIIDIENKMFTHRPDLFGVLGVAREIAGIQHKSFKSPDWYKEDIKLREDGRTQVLPLKVTNEAGKLVPRFMAVAIKDIKVAESPVWLQTYLSRVGIRPINNIVDLTNFYMYLTAQPLHAYDYDKLKTGTLGVRLSKKGETLKIIGGKEIKLQAGAVVITDGQKPVGLGGVMGGAETEVDENTKNIVLEAANFDMTLTRKTAMAYGLFTDAATRFSKNQSPLQNAAVLCKAVSHIKDIAGGRVASKVMDSKAAGLAQKSVKTTIEFINSRLGLDLSTDQVKTLLENVEFSVKQGANSLEVNVPFWRMDIKIAEDVVEEVGRLYGYDKLSQQLPPRPSSAAKLEPMLEFKARLRSLLAAAGGNEVLTYSFVNEKLLRAVGQDPLETFHVRNAISPDLQYYRLSLMPSLLSKIQPNIKAGFDKFMIFELGRGHNKHIKDDEKLPKELQMLAVAVAAKDKPTEAPYYSAKHLCEYLLGELGLSAKFAAYSKLHSLTYYQPGRSADILVGGQMIGRVGEFSDQTSSSLKLPANCAGFELDLEKLLVLCSPPVYQPLNRFPETEQDVCLRSAASLNYEQLTDFMRAFLDEASRKSGYRYQLQPIDIFSKDKSHKQTTWRISLAHPERTLTTEEVNILLDELAAQAKTKLKAERI